jgi:hypothetical protein
VWSLVEIDVGVICACMPGIAALMRRVWPHIFGSRIGSNNSNGYQGQYDKDGLSKNKRSGNGSSNGSGFTRVSSPIERPPRTISKSVQVSVEYDYGVGNFDAAHGRRTSKSDELELIDRMPNETYANFEKYTRYEHESDGDGSISKVSAKGGATNAQGSTVKGVAVRFCPLHKSS